MPCPSGPIIAHMPESNPQRILLLHDQWATTQVLTACAQLPDEQFHRRFDIGLGSLHDTLTHIISVIRALTDTLAGAPPRPRLETDGQFRTPAQLQALLDEASPAFAAEVNRCPLEQTVARTTRDGKTLTLTRAAVLAHVTSHGTHHRAQCLNMLRRLSISPLPPISVAEWTWLADQ